MLLYILTLLCTDFMTLEKFTSFNFAIRVCIFEMMIVGIHALYGICEITFVHKYT